MDSSDVLIGLSDFSNCNAAKSRGKKKPTSGKIWAKYSWQKNKVFQAGWVLVQVNQNRVPGITWEMSITLLRMRSLWLKWQCGWCWCKREFETMPMTTAGMENTHVLLMVAWKRKMHAGGQASGGSLAQRKQSLLAITCPIRTTRTMSMLIFYCQCALDVNVYSRVRGCRCVICMWRSEVNSFCTLYLVLWDRVSLSLA